MEHKSLLIAKLDKVMSELAELRQMLVDYEPADAHLTHPIVGTPAEESSKEVKAETKEEKAETKEAEVVVESESTSIFDLGSDSDLFFDSSEDQDIDEFLRMLQDKSEVEEKPERDEKETEHERTEDEAPVISEVKEPTSETTEVPTSSEAKERTSEQVLLDSFIERGSVEEMRQTFEERVKFELIPYLSLGDNYLFANELFMGNQAELRNVLSELEQMSSISQAEDYLYNRLGLNPEQEEVQRFVAFVEEHAKSL